MISAREPGDARTRAPAVTNSRSGGHTVIGMAERSYHHGDLRAALLTRAEEMLRVSGTNDMSLRELARMVGVSHAAPRRHFADKAALLEALAAEGFRRLGTVLTRAAERDDRSLAATLTDIGVAYVRFATANPALLDLMFASKHRTDVSEELRRAAEGTFASVVALIAAAQEAGDLVPDDLHRVGTVLLATLQGLVSLATSGMVDTLDDELIAYTIESVLTGLTPRT